MEQGLRDCCRSIRLGKILIHSDEDTHEAKRVYAKVPVDIYKRKVLLMYPIMSKSHLFRFLLKYLEFECIISMRIYVYGHVKTGKYLDCYVYFVCCFY